ncbi:hypothetical protein [Capnocytophaga catalasegens]|uniref:Uncharacterized protein n=1 Tax=Capnocytophaga catalasegens TaxID=1004260 RepID=A0AAV5ARR8_9FLAO|nr:hypothetical protein [Capnocytophaga catalasegens]GIZ15912.1 hypothetical protein RCZ03_19120 [Capnocytophaga catalasegens]GJM49976.1 hypothetical protein RCZ15_09510 [Capnocytophaga catalasegens]GJM54132.1 hypothetical protein RCZ16_24480 [Capnocytophaga catalasegens]
MTQQKFDQYATQMGNKLHGLLSVNFINIDNGSLIHSVSFSGIDYKATAKFEAEIVKNSLRAIKFTDSSDETLHEIIISNDEHIHFLYVATNADFLVHLITNAQSINYALLHMTHNECWQSLIAESFEKDNSTTEVSHKKVKQFKQLFFN